MAQNTDNGDGLAVDFRLVLGVSLRAGKVEFILPGSPAETAGLDGGAAVTKIGGVDIAKIGDAVACLAAAAFEMPVSVEVERAGERSVVQIVPAPTLFPDHAFGRGLEFNKFCDKNCDCTIEQPGWICKTIYRYVGEGPNGGVLIQKICVSVDPSPPHSVEIPTVCWTGEFV